MTFKLALFGAVSLSLVMPASAQDAADTQKTLDTVRIDGSRLDQTAAELGSSVSIISAEDIEELGFDFAIDAVASAPGVTVNQNGGFGGAASVRIRGASTDQTLVIVDGVPVGDPTGTGGGFNFAYLDTENIERIEVLKGPQSTLWGADAIGGVVFITTKPPEPEFGGSAFVEYGSFETVRGGMSFSNANEIGDFRIAATGITSDGISKADEANGNFEDDGYNSSTIAGKVGFNLPANARLETSLNWNSAYAETDSYSFGAQGSTADGDETTENETLSGGVSLKVPLMDDRFANELFIGYSEIERENFTNGASSYSAEGDRLIYRYQGTLKINDMNKLALGAEREETTSNDLESDITSYFGLYELKPLDSLTLTAGLRHDDSDRFDNETTGRVAVAWNATDNIIVRSSWGQGFKAPSIFQSTYICTFCGLTAPNANLLPETSEAYDLGVEWRSGNGDTGVGVTVFNQETENMIDFSFTAGYDNIALVESRGVEVYGSHQFTDAIGVALNYAFIDAEDGNGGELRRLPAHTGDLTLSFTPDGPFSGAVLVRYSGEEFENATTTLESWTRVDVNASYELTDQLELFGRIENLTDEEYQQVLGYGTAGLSGSIGLRARY